MSTIKKTLVAVVTICFNALNNGEREREKERERERKSIW